MRCSPKAKTRRLLRVLFLRLSAVSAGSGQTGRCETVTARFPPPWSVEELDACYVVREHDGQALACVYFEEEPRRFADQRRRTADRVEIIAKLPEMLLSGLSAPVAGVASVGRDVVFNAHFVL